MYQNSILFYFCILLVFGCEHSQDLVKFDSRDLLIKTSFTVADFEPSSECESCHPTHYKEWSGSMHAYAFTDPVWFKQHSKEQEHFNSKDKELGQFCIMCHSPVGFLTGAIEDPYTFDISQKESLATQVKEGISCSFCHATTHLSPSTNVDFSNNINEGIQFFLNPGEVKYGSIKDPLPNNFHESEFHPDYDKSEYCRACHNLTISGKDAEMTFNEWSQTSFEAMGIECQSCHMESYSGYAVDTKLFPNAPYRKNLHRHNFIGIDHALTPFPEEETQLKSINDLLESAAELNFSEILPDYILSGEIFNLGIIVTNTSGHNLPTGTTFSRQIWLELNVLADLDTIYRSGHLDSNGDLYDFYIDPQRLEDPDLTIFRTVLYDANGDSGLRHVSVERMVKKSDTTLPVQGSIIANFKFTIPENTENLIIKVRLRFRSLPPFFVREFGLAEEEKKLNIFNGDSLSAVIPVRTLN